MIRYIIVKKMVNQIKSKILINKIFNQNKSI